MIWVDFFRIYEQIDALTLEQGPFSKDLFGRKDRKMGRTDLSAILYNVTVFTA
jgi:hypothetical protein